MTFVDSDKRRGPAPGRSGNQLDARVHRQLRGGPPAAGLIRVLVRHGRIGYALCPPSSFLSSTRTQRGRHRANSQCRTCRLYSTCKPVLVLLLRRHLARHATRVRVHGDPLRNRRRFEQLVQAPRAGRDGAGSREQRARRAGRFQRHRLRARLWPQSPARERAPSGAAITVLNRLHHHILLFVCGWTSGSHDDGPADDCGA